MSDTTGFAYRFETRLSFDGMWASLNRGPWRWRGSDSDAHGAKLWCYADTGVKLQIIGAKPRWVLQVSLRPGAALTPAEVRRVVDETLLPAVMARDVAPAEPIA